MLHFLYGRDVKGRVVRIDEYVDGGPEPNVTEYTYGDGRLTEEELDEGSAQQVEPDKLYYSWFADLSEDSFEPGDPNRLVREVRTGENEYYNEYRYDAGGNRLVKIEKQNVAPVGEPPDWVFSRITRYNYAYYPNYAAWDPRVAPNEELGLGEPDPSASPAYDWSYNTYEDGAIGQDKLLSYTTYLFDGDGQPLPHEPIYTAYEYVTSYGKMSRRMSWNGETHTQIDTRFTYSRQRLQSAVVDEITWPENPEESYDEWVDRERFTEVYGYNVFGERIGVMHCTFLSWGEYSPPNYYALSGCSRYVRMYDYVDGIRGRELLVERQSDIHCWPGPCPELLERFFSVYTWGPMGLVARRGVSIRNGSWDPDGGEYCDPEHPEQGVTGEFVEADPNAMSDYTYMADHIGNIVALVDGNPDSPTFGTARRQVFDAFGNSVGGYIMFQCASDHDWTDDPWHLGHFADPPELPCPNNPAQSVERMQTGSFNWRGAEGSITDRGTEDMPDTEENVLRWSAYTRPSTGLIYMQNRYYEPETGRFTQADPMPYGIETMLTGQNNRWTYCANDPVNWSDPSGLNVWGGIAGVLAVVTGVLGMLGMPTSASVAAIGAGLAAMQGAGWLTTIATALWGALMSPAGIIITLLLLFLLVVWVVDYLQGPCRFDSPQPVDSGVEWVDP